MNKALLTLSIMIFERQSASSRKSNHSKSRAGTDQRGPEVPLVGGYLNGYPMDGK